MKFLVLLFIFIIMCMVGTILIFQYFGWTGLACVLVVLFLGVIFLKRLMSWLFIRLMMTPFRKKAAVLKNATVEVHRVTPADPPDRSDEIAEERALLEAAGLDDEDLEEEEEEYSSEEYLRDLIAHDAAADWYEIDVTITPATPSEQREQTPFQYWEPAELMLVPFDYSGNRFEDDDPDENAGLGIHAVQIWQGSAFQEDEEGKYAGPQRILLHVGVPRGSNDMAFVYYFEKFGKVELPTINV
ncbi:hypothetical protein CA54_23500 [Symmachiella macrocystis]|uniref:Uncharacterized protein n=1 Tax=Symmachiella macrocystis TaxID=2527985 RepID=A0A5C6BNC0_9PLAN|nr:hypothetical protein [Symmachiella macrocystis]TWU13515.1 hypothetical protein CA54_23500 [Symmachiella macrocystis]